MINRVLLGSICAVAIFLAMERGLLRSFPPLLFAEAKAAAMPTSVRSDCSEGCLPLEPAVWTMGTFPCEGVFVWISAVQHAPSPTVSKCTNSPPCAEVHPCKYDVSAAWGWQPGSVECDECEIVRYHVNGLGPFNLYPPDGQQTIDDVVPISCGAITEFTIDCLDGSGDYDIIGGLMIGCSGCPQPMS